MSCIDSGIRSTCERFMTDSIRGPDHHLHWVIWKKSISSNHSNGPANTHKTVTTIHAKPVEIFARTYVQSDTYIRVNMHTHATGAQTLFCNIETFLREHAGTSSSWSHVPFARHVCFTPDCRYPTSHCRRLHDRPTDIRNR